MFPVGLNVPVVGSYNSAVASPPRYGSPLGALAVPPAIRTLPFFSRVAVWNIRGLDIEPVALNLPVA